MFLVSSCFISIVYTENLFLFPEMSWLCLNEEIFSQESQHKRGMLCLPFGSITSRMSSKILWKRFYQVIYLAGSYPQPTRQKQYFEQRKRQQQQQNSNGLESYSDKKAPCTQCPENNRSLDILSLLNLSTNGQDFTSRFSEGTIFVLWLSASLCSLNCLQ